MMNIDTEIYLMKAVLHQLRAAIYAIVTYNVSVPYEGFLPDPEFPDVDLDWSFLAKNSDILTIRPGHEDSWEFAHSEFNNVESSLQNSWNFCQIV